MFLVSYVYIYMNQFKYLLNFNPTQVPHIRPFAKERKRKDDDEDEQISPQY